MDVPLKLIETKLLMEASHSGYLSVLFQEGNQDGTKKVILGLAFVKKLTVNWKIIQYHYTQQYIFEQDGQLPPAFFALLHFCKNGIKKRKDFLLEKHSFFIIFSTSSNIGKFPFFCRRILISKVEETFLKNHTI